ncbi:(2Fe-2S)-binding protein [Neobacillus sp. Marseille-QA0830]
MNPKESIPIPADLPISSEMELTLKVNGLTYQVQTLPTKKLIHILRDDLKLTGTKISCEIGRCGACSIEMDGKLANSCLVMAYQANHSSITTIEGLAQERLDRIQQAFLEEGGFQCGYCTPGMIMAVRSLLQSHPNPTPDQMTEALSGNLCRCTGYGGIIRSVQKITEILR